MTICNLVQTFEKQIKNSYILTINKNIDWLKT